ncbi:uncharacterized protein isoform X2 [Musca autumnalis]|uniref:uncharacterized protein isoform X2 n=1 Tax=Musca autumnalis TaxID=221902 RepID=UPI003CF6F4A0
MSQSVSRRIWTQEETLLFLKCYKDWQKQICHENNKKYGYENVLQDMFERGFEDTSITAKELEEQMNTLHTAYLNAKENGNCKNFAPYIKLMNTITEDMFDSEKANVSDPVEEEGNNLLIEFVEDNDSVYHLSDCEVREDSIVTTKYTLDTPLTGIDPKKPFKLKVILDERPNTTSSKKYNNTVDDRIAATKIDKQNAINNQKPRIVKKPGMESVRKKQTAKKPTNCLLCLELINVNDMCIKAQSNEWKEKRVKALMDKHLWYIGK